jgi:hypothetical protein
MPFQHMLDDGQAEAGAAGFPRAAMIHPVEAFGKTRQVLAGDTDAVVGDRKPRRLLRLPAPGKQDLATLRRVAHGVARQIGKGRTQFPGAAQQPPRPMIF